MHSCLAHSEVCHSLAETLALSPTTSDSRSLTHGLENYFLINLPKNSLLDNPCVTAALRPAKLSKTFHCAYMQKLGAQRHKGSKPEPGHIKSLCLLLSELRENLTCEVIMSISRSHNSCRCSDSIAYGCLPHLYVSASFNLVWLMTWSFSFWTTKYLKRMNWNVLIGTNQQSSVPAGTHRIPDTTSSAGTKLLLLLSSVG